MEGFDQTKYGGVPHFSRSLQEVGWENVGRELGEVG
jgi:hypothetical protein